MKLPSTPFLTAVLALGCICTTAFCDEKPTMPLLERPVPLKAVLEKARALGIPTEKPTFASDDVIAVNDEVSFLANVTEDESVRQWIILLRAQHVTEDEDRANKVYEQVYYTNLAAAPVVFPAERIGGVAIRTVGPFTSKASKKETKDIWSAALVSPRYLRIGLIGPSLTVGTFQEKKLHGAMSLSTSPIPEKVFQDGATLREQGGLAEEDIRGFAAFFPAMLNFFTIANQTEGVNAIVREMIDIPWMSLALNGGRLKNINFDLVPPFIDMPAAYWSLPAGTRVRTLGVVLTLNGKPALQIAFAVTKPRPPLYNCAGIVGLAAQRPGGKGPRLTLTLLGASPAADRTPIGVRPGKR